MKKKVIYAIILVLLLFGTAAFANQICKAKFTGDSTTIINGFYEEEKNSIDVIFIGSSNCFCTVNPLILYEKYGITAYDFASSSQPMNISLLYLKEALKTQNPKVVALEANMLVGNGPENATEAALRWGYTDIPFSIDKLRCIYQSTGKIDGEYLSYVFPMLFYHNRWKELTKSDYTYFAEDKWNPTKGYLMTDEVSESAIDFSDYELEGIANLDEANLACLDEMIALCRKQGVKLMLFKSPRQEWYSFHTKAVDKLAAERGIAYVDYNTLIDEIGLNGETDFRDAEHLNNAGAAKVTEHLGTYLVEQYGLEDRRSTGETVKSYEDALRYQERQYENTLPGIVDMTEYLETIGSMQDVTIVIAAEGKCGTPDEDAQQRLYAYHFQKANLKKGTQRVFHNGTSVFKAEGEEPYVSAVKCEDAEIVLVKQKGATQLQIDGTDYHKVDNGINIVVYDHVTGQIADAVGFDALNGYVAVR